jgi:serine/threonine-protein kinase RsbW
VSDEPEPGTGDPSSPAASKLVITSRLEAIDEARRWASTQMVEHGLPESWVIELELALTEALSNVMRHAYEGAEDQEIHLALLVDERGVRLDIRDFGVTFDFESLGPVDLENPQEGGYGVFMIESLVDDVAREPGRPRGNWLRLTKLRPAGD